MITSIDEIRLIGRVARVDAITFVGSQALQKLTFALAVERRIKGADGQWGALPVFYRVTVLGDRAEQVRDFAPVGDMVQVVGTLEIDPATGTPRIYTSNGQTKVALDVLLSRIEYLGRPENRTQRESREAQSQGVAAGSQRAATGQIDY